LSHADQIQQWQTSIPQTRNSKGWGGRTADILAAGNANQDISMNISLSGSNIFQAGNFINEYAIRATAGGSVGINTYTGSGALNAALSNGAQSLLEDIFRKTYADKINDSQSQHVDFSAAMAGANNFSTNFSSNPVSANMELIAKTISVRNTLGFGRQTFFINYGGWDHHDEVLNNQTAMLSVLSKALSEFDSALNEMGLADCVTSNGSDHAWGGNVMVMGGSVLGGSVYGQYPSLALNGVDDVGGAIMLPSISTDEYYAELAKWFGVPNGDLAYVLPNINNFYNPYSGSYPIGFMS